MAEDLATLTLRVQSKGVKDAKRGLDDVSRSGAAAEKGFGRLSRAGKELDRTLKSSRRAMDLFKGALVAIGADRAVRSILDASIELQRIQSTLTQVTGSSQKAAKEFQFVSDVSDKLGLNIQKTASGYARLAASATSAGESNAALHKGFIGLADAFTVLHAPADEVNRILIQLDQAFSLGKVQMQDLRAISNSMPSVFSDLDQAFKGTGLSVAQMLKSGGIPAELFFKRFTNELANKYGPQAVVASHNLMQAMNRLDNAFFKIESSGNVTGLSSSIDSLAKTLNDPATLKGLSAVAQGIINLTNDATKGVAEIGQLIGAIGSLNLGKIEKTIFSHPLLPELLGGPGVVAHVASGHASAKNSGPKTVKPINVTADTPPSVAKALSPTSSPAGNTVSQAHREIQALQKQVALYGDLSNAQKMRIELSRGYFGAVSPSQSAELMKLSEELDTRQSLTKATQAQKLAEQQRLQNVKQLKMQLATPAQRNSMQLDNTLGQINSNVKDQQLKAQLTARAWDQYRQKAQQDMTGVSKFAEQAARNIQNELGNTLQTTLSGNFSGILSSWDQMLQKMVAQASAAQIGDALFGKGYGSSTNQIGGLIGKGISALFGGSASTLPDLAGMDTTTMAGLSGVTAPSLGVGLANGGPTAANSIHPVVERGTPEMYNVAGRSYLLTGSQSGNVIPMRPARANTSSSASSGVEVNVYTGSGEGKAQVNQKQINGKTVVDVQTRNFVNDLAKNGPMSKAMIQKWSLHQTGTS